MIMLRLAAQKTLQGFARGLSTLQKSPASKKLLSQIPSSSGHRLMSGHGPDISKIEAAIYIIVGGGGFAAFGLYSTMQMRNRIEAFETGEVIPFKSLTDDQLLVFREKFRKLHSEQDEEEDDSGESDEGSAADPEQEQDTGLQMRKLSKDTVIFIEPPKE